MADTSDIQAKVIRQDAKRRNGRAVREAGWIVYDSPTGKTLSFDVYPTQEAAQAAIPALLNGISNRRDVDAERDAQQAKAIDAAAVPARGWSNASKGIGSRAHGLWLPTPDDAAGGCYYCGVVGCTECGTD
jgi:hypothetical protein